MKWGFAPPRQGAINVDALQTKWDRDHSLKKKVRLKCGLADWIMIYVHHLILTSHNDPHYKII